LVISLFEFGICLVFGAWYLVLGIWCFAFAFALALAGYGGQVRFGIFRRAWIQYSVFSIQESGFSDWPSVCLFIVTTRILNRILV